MHAWEYVDEKDWDDDCYLPKQSPININNPFLKVDLPASAMTFDLKQVSDIAFKNDGKHVRSLEDFGSIVVELSNYKASEITFFTPSEHTVTFCNLRSALARSTSTWKSSSSIVTARVR